MPRPALRFTITAQHGMGTRTETRTHATSAMVLADRMFREGLQNIRVISSDGVSHEREAFGLTLPLVKLLGLAER